MMARSSNTTRLSSTVRLAIARCARLFRLASGEAARNIVSAWSAVRADTMRDWRQTQTYLRSAQSLVIWLLAPEQLVPALKIARRTIWVLASMFFVAAGLIIYAGPMLFWGSVYEEHKWNPIPEPHRTIFVVAMFSLGGFWLYVLRCQERVLYGCIEIAAAVLTFYFTVVNRFPVETRLELREFTTACIQIAAGLYIFVRGLDNIGSGLKPGSRMHKLWWGSRFFSMGP